MKFCYLVRVLARRDKTQVLTYWKNNVFSLTMINHIKSVTNGVLKDFIKFFNLKTNSGRIKVVAVLMLLIAVFVFVQKSKTEKSIVEDLNQIVFTGTVNSISGVTDFSVVGRVESKDQADIQAETAGRVVKVNTTLGQELAAGTVIAQLENSSQYASLLQAEGVYEAALAASAQSDISVEDSKNSLIAAQNTAISTYRSAYTTVNAITLNYLDTFYSDVSKPIFGVKIDSQGQSTALVNKRKELQSQLTQWQARTVSISNTDSLKSEIEKVKLVANHTLSLLDEFIVLTTEAGTTDTLDGSSVNSYTANLTTQRASLSTALTSLDSAISNLNSAEEQLNRAEIGGSNSTELSAANAQLKQALGSLKAAQANYQKTILRTPIAGTLNELKIKEGDYVPQFSSVALVANNNALEVTAFLGEFDLSKVEVGQTVLLEGTVEGVITAVAPAVDTDTKKTEVKIGAESDLLKTGDTVTITFEAKTSEDVLADLYVPITAIKFSAIDGSIFTVENEKLVKHPVKLGDISGNFVKVIEGIDVDTEFVLDARGLTEGQSVEAIKKN